MTPAACPVIPGYLFPGHATLSTQCCLCCAVYIVHVCNRLDTVCAANVQLCLVGKVLEVDSSATRARLVLDDGTGQVEMFWPFDSFTDHDLVGKSSICSGFGCGNDCRLCHRLDGADAAV